VLRAKFFSAEQVEAIVRDYRNAGLEPAAVAMLTFAEKVTLHAYRVTPSDIEELRSHGFTDAEILDIALTAAARSFFSKTMDAVGAEPDAVYLDLEEPLRRTLAVGRPFGSTGGVEETG
jgi:alkylhydroperoxidase family enzyme